MERGDMEHKPLLLFLLLFLFVVLVYSAPAEAISLSAPTMDEMTYNFEPNFEIKGNCDKNAAPGCTCAKRGSQGFIDIYVRDEKGNLSQYFTLHEESLYFEKADEWRCFSYDVKFPASTDIPGKNVVRVGMVESMGTTTSGTGVGARVGVEQNIIFLVPYPDEYIQSRLYSAVSSKEVVFTLNLINLGKKNLIDVSSVLKLINSTDRKVKELDFEAVPLLNVNERKNVSLTILDAELEADEYLAKVFVSYAGKKSVAETEFIIEEKIVGVPVSKVQDNLPIIWVIMGVIVFLLTYMLLNYIKRKGILPNL